MDRDLFIVAVTETTLHAPWGGVRAPTDTAQDREVCMTVP